MKYIKLFETYQWLNRESSDPDERDFITTVESLLDWAGGPEWSSDWTWLEDILMVDDEPLEEGEAIGYHELLKRGRDQEIEVYSQQVEGQVDNSWTLDGVSFTLISWDWPFTSDLGDLTDIEKRVVDQLVKELTGDRVMDLANLVDIIEYVQLVIREKGEDPDKVNSTGFKNWYLLQRSGAN